MKFSDTRVKVTKSIFHRALIGLLKEKPIDRITVKELVEAAELNRSTFYLHYSCPLDVLREMQNQILEEKGKNFALYWVGIPEDGRMAELIALTLEDKELFRLFLSDHGDPRFLSDVKPLIRDGILAGWHKDHPRIPQETLSFLFDYVFAGSSRLIQSWINDPQDISPEAFSMRLERLGHYALLAAEKF